VEIGEPKHKRMIEPIEEPVLAPLSVPEPVEEPLEVPDGQPAVRRD